MALRPVSRRSVPDEVFEQLLGEMVDGALAADEPLPSERRLAEVLGVSRPAVREAIQRMAQAGLVDVRHGDATMVRDFRRHAGLDLLPRLLLPGGRLDFAVARSVLEARLHIGPKIAELAAQRGGKDIAAALDETVNAMAGTEDPIVLQHRALEYWDLVVDGADSIVFRMMFNGLRLAYQPAIEALATVMAPEVGNADAYRTLADAIRAADPPAARDAAEELLRPATAKMLAAIEMVREDR